MIVEYLGNNEINNHGEYDPVATKKAMQYVLGRETLRSILRPHTVEADEGLKQLTFYLWKKYCQEKRRLKNEH